MSAGTPTPFPSRERSAGDPGAIPSAAIPSASVPSGGDTGSADLPSLSPVPGSSSARRGFEAFELVRVMSHYDIGSIEELVDFPRGSRKAPKLMLRSDKGLYLLKRRARGKDDPHKVAFCHALQTHLADKQYPLPHLVGTRSSNNSMLKLDASTYELFEYIKGTTYDQSLEATTDAGRVLALLHKLAHDFKTPFQPSRGTYHNSRSVRHAVAQAPETLSKLPGPADAKAIRALVSDLDKRYKDAVERIQSEGMDSWPEQVVHSDWHPGNLLYRGSRVVAVIDYDAARYSQRIIDAANGALQFSILADAGEPEQWPAEPDRSRFKRFMRGYDSVPDMMLSRAEIRTVPWLMIEALIAESIIPIAATGYFAKMPGPRFLQMVQRKAAWMAEHADELIELIEE